LAVHARLCSNYIASPAITKKQKKIAQQPRKAVLTQDFVDATAVEGSLVNSGNVSAYDLSADQPDERP